MSNPKISNEAIKTFKSAQNVEYARLVKKSTGAKVPHIKEIKSKTAHKII